MNERSHGAEAQLYTANLDHTLKELQKKIREHENELQKVSQLSDETHLAPVDQGSAPFESS